MERNAFRQVIHDPSLKDARERAFQRVSGRIERFPAPWSLFATGNASIKRMDLLAIGGFDENFRRWGSADAELGYRLYRNGVVIRFRRSARGLHYPHPEERATKIASSLYNRGYMLNKHKTLEVELSIVFGGWRVNDLLDEVRQLVETVLPQPLTNEALRQILPLKKGATLLVGATPELCQALNPAQAVTYSRALLDRIRSEARCSVSHLLGLGIPVAEGAFETVIVSDFWQAVSDQLLRSIFWELTRIGTSIYVIYSPPGKAHSAPPSRWLSDDELDATLKPVNLSSERITPRIVRVFRAKQSRHNRIPRHGGSTKWPFPQRLIG